MDLVVKEQDSIKYSRSTVELYGTKSVAELNRSHSMVWSLLLKLSFGETENGAGISNTLPTELPPVARRTGLEPVTFALTVQRELIC